MSGGLKKRKKKARRTKQKKRARSGVEMKEVREDFNKQLIEK